MKIQSVYIRNFRKLKNYHIDFDEKQIVLVGTNNSRKTSVINAIAIFFTTLNEIKKKSQLSFDYFILLTANIKNIADLLVVRLLTPISLEKLALSNKGK